MEKYDLIVIGMGPSSIFLAYELIQLNKVKNVLLIEEGKKVEKRFCPIEQSGKCIKCRPFCNITSGFSGAGAFSDGKLSLYNPEDDDIYVGGDLHEYIGVQKTKELIDYADEVYLKFGADKKLEGIDHKDEIKKICDKSKKEGINLINIPIRHLGTEKSHEIYVHVSGGKGVWLERCQIDYKGALSADAFGHLSYTGTSQMRIAASGAYILCR